MFVNWSTSVKIDGTHVSDCFIFAEKSKERNEGSDSSTGDDDQNGLPKDTGQGKNTGHYSIHSKISSFFQEDFLTVKA